MRRNQWLVYGAFAAVAYWLLTKRGAAGSAVPIRAQDQIDQLAARSAMGVPAGQQSGAIITGPHDFQTTEQTAILQEPWPGAGYSVPVYPVG